MQRSNWRYLSMTMHKKTLLFYDVKEFCREEQQTSDFKQRH